MRFCFQQTLHKSFTLQINNNEKESWRNFEIFVRLKMFKKQKILLNSIKKESYYKIIRCFHALFSYIYIYIINSKLKKKNKQGQLLIYSGIASSLMT